MAARSRTDLLCSLRRARGSPKSGAGALFRKNQEAPPRTRTPCALPQSVHLLFSRGSPSWGHARLGQWTTRGDAMWCEFVCGERHRFSMKEERYLNHVVRGGRPAHSSYMDGMSTPRSQRRVREKGYAIPLHLDQRHPPWNSGSSSRSAAVHDFWVEKNLIRQHAASSW